MFYWLSAKISDYYKKSGSATQIKSGQRTRTDLSPKMIYKWPTSTLKDAHIKLTIGKTQIKTTMRYHLTPIRMAIIPKPNQTKPRK